MFSRSVFIEVKLFFLFCFFFCSVFFRSIACANKKTFVFTFGKKYLRFNIIFRSQIGNILCDVQTPTNGPALLPDFQELEAFRHLQAQQQAPTIENRNLSSTYLPASPLPRQQTGNIFNFGGFNAAPPPPPNDQFQAQLIQQLQNLNNTYHNQQKCSLYGQQLSGGGGLYVPQAPQQNNANSPSFRLSQASSPYSSSPILSHHGSNHESPSRQQGDNKRDKDDSHLIKPLSQGETITTTDSDGRVKVIVPVNEDDNIPVPRLEPPPSGHRRSKEASPTKLGTCLDNSFYSSQ